MKFLHRYANVIAFTVVICTFGLVLAACEPSKADASSRAAAQAEQKNVEAQNNVIAKATAKVPVPQLNNFLARENLAEYMKRMDDPAKTWYIYVLGNGGEKIGYYVASSYPQSICTFMTPPQQVKEVNVYGEPNPIAVTNAPALDGVYYGAGGCETVFFFDAASSAMIMLTGMNTWASDVPLDIDVPLIRVEGTANSASVPAN